MPFVFISYRTSDEAFAANLIEGKLRERLGAGKVFFDNRSIGLGRDFQPDLWGALAKCDVLLAVIGRDWHGPLPDGTSRIADPGDFVRQEVELALRIGIRVVPVLVGDIPALRADSLPTELRALANRQYTRLRTRGAEEDVARLVNELAGLDDPTTAAAPTHEPGTVAIVRPAGTSGQVEPADLREPLRLAVAESALAGGTIETGTGATVLVPRPTAAVQVAGAFVAALDAALRRRAGGIRVKVAVADAAAAAEARVLVNAPILDDVLRYAAGACVVLAVSPEFYETVVRPQPRFVDPSTFAPAALGGSGETCWIHVPGYPAPPKVPGLNPPRSGPPRDPHPGFVNHGTVVSGNSFGGDYVAGDKHVRTDRRPR